jgi:hypothetical protein
VFVISWVNPDERLAHKGFEDYLLEGPLAALDAVQAATGEREVNAIGYCLGGTLLATTLSYLPSRLRCSTGSRAGPIIEGITYISSAANAAVEQPTQDLHQLLRGGSVDGPDSVTLWGPPRLLPKGMIPHRY